MHRNLTLALAVLTFVIISRPVPAVAQRGGFSGDRMFGFMDRDQSGELEPEELERLPGSFRGWMEENHVDLSRPVSRDDFNEMMPQMIESLRRQREEGGDSGRRGWGGGFGRSEDSDRWSRGRDGDARSSGSDSKPKEPARVTIVLPADYTAGDFDRDGQLGLYEWQQWKGRAARHEFRRLDLNGDGFVTPRELALVAAGKGGAPMVAGNSPVVVATAAPSPPITAAPAAPPTSSSTVDSSTARQARTYFQLLDNDRNGTITPDEWDRSRRLKPMFEAAGSDLSQPMTEAQFVEGYAKAMAKSS